ncbi:MAG: AraC family transcriptional regulator [Lachnospiraceae bacterium]|nr:AraC family transcriptional regulator [Lachnospiraceae bacterium]
MAKSLSNRILATPSAYAKEHFLYVQETGTLQSIEPHISQRKNLNSFLFFVVIAGEGILTYNNNSYLLKGGDCVWIDCRQQYSHESSASSPWKLMWVHFYGAAAAAFHDSYLAAGNHFIFSPSDISSFIECLTSLYDIQKENNSLTELMANKYLTDIITLCYTENNSNGKENISPSHSLAQVRAYLDEHFTEKINLEELANRFFISKFHLSREYKRIYGITIGNDITAKRVSRAKSLLRFSNQSIEQIAIASGFQDAAYFIKVFKHAENMTPLEYRKKW